MEHVLLPETTAAAAKHASDAPVEPVGEAPPAATYKQGHRTSTSNVGGVRSVGSQQARTRTHESQHAPDALPAHTCGTGRPQKFRAKGGLPCTAPDLLTQHKNRRPGSFVQDTTAAE